MNSPYTAGHFDPNCSWYALFCCDIRSVLWVLNLVYIFYVKICVVSNYFNFKFHDINSLAPEGCENKSKNVFLKLIFQIDILSTSSKIGHGWELQSPIDGTLTLVEVMAWYHKAITWAKVDPDPCYNIVSLCHNALRSDCIYSIPNSTNKNITTMI